MKTHQKVIFLFVVLCMLPFGRSLWADESAELAAQAASLGWLALVDHGKYAESWEGAAEYFKNAVTLQQWQQSMVAFRKPLGGVVSRKLKSMNYTSTLPGAPDGEYVVIQYDTSFENKRSAAETITPMLDKDGKWRVAGYYIK